MEEEDHRHEDETRHEEGAENVNGAEKEPEHARILPKPDPVVYDAPVALGAPVASGALPRSYTSPLPEDILRAMASEETGRAGPGDDIIQTAFRFDVLARLPRTGFLIRGIDRPESVAEHSFIAAVMAALLVPEIKKEGFDVDGEKLVSMVLLHEAGEILLGDIPAPAAAFFGPGGKADAERAAAAAVLRGHPECALVADEFEEGGSLEARIARSLDKLQLMVRVLKYESEGKGCLEEFWGYGGNFPRCGVKAVDRLFDRVRALRGAHSLDYMGMVPEPSPRPDSPEKPC